MTEKFQLSPLDKTENVPALEEELEVLIQDDVEYVEENVEDVEQEDDDDGGERSEEDDSKSSEEGIQDT